MGHSESVTQLGWDTRLKVTISQLNDILHPLNTHSTPVIYLFEVVNNIDFSGVRGICLWNMKFLCLFLSVNFNFFIDLFISIFYFHLVLGHGFLQSQMDFFQ